MKVNKATLKFTSQIAIIILFFLALTELALAIWTVADDRYKSLAYSLSDVGYIDLWILRYLSLCLFVSSIITLVMCLILIWGLYSAQVFLFIATTMLTFICIGEFVISILTFSKKYEMRITLIEQLPKLVITYRQGTDERARRALDFLQSSFRCCGSDGRLSFQNNVPPSCNMYSIGCLTRTMYFLDASMDALAYVLLFFSLIKLFIVIFFYAYQCINLKQSSWTKGNRENEINQFTDPDSSSEAFNQIENERRHNDYVDQQDIRFDDEHLLNDNHNSPRSYSRSFYQTEIYNPTDVRKLSSISERTEKTETDDSEFDLLRQQKPPINKRRAIITPVTNTKPAVQSRRRPDRIDDSGVEGSLSEKSFEDGYLVPKPNDPLTFSQVFLTSVSPQQVEYSTVRPKSILKQPPVDERLVYRGPQPTPRRNRQQDVTLV